VGGDQVAVLPKDSVENPLDAVMMSLVYFQSLHVACIEISISPATSLWKSESESEFSLQIEITL
jgi:hypothetical protein